MAIALVDSVEWHPPSGTNGGTSSSIDTTGANLIVVSETFINGAALAITDSKGNSYTNIATEATGGNKGVALYYAENPTVGTGHTFTIAGTSVFPAMIVYAFSGAATSSVAGGTHPTNSVVSATIQPGSVTPSEDGCVIVTCEGGHDQRSLPDTISAGYSTPIATPNTGGHQSLHDSYIVQTTATATNPTWTNPNGSDSTWAAISWFKPDTGGGGTSTRTATPVTVNLSGAFVRAATSVKVALSSPLVLWENIQPVDVPNTSGVDTFGFVSILADMFTSGTVYLGTTGYGIWKSTDDGDTWAKVSTGTGEASLDGGSLWTLGQDFYNGAIYTSVGHGAQGLWKSTNGGVDWTDVLSGKAAAVTINTNDVYTVSCDPYLEDHLLVSFHGVWSSPAPDSPSGTLESFDGGSTWSINYPPVGSAWGAGDGVWFGNDSDTWILGSQNDGGWVTRDSGANWTQFTTTDLTHGAIHAGYRDPIDGALVVCLSSTIWRSLDDGDSWTDITSAALSGTSYQAVASDGVTMWTAGGGPTGGDNGSTGNWRSRSLYGSDSWVDLGYSPTAIEGYNNGPVQTSFDPVSGYVYSADWQGGVFRIAGEPVDSGQVAVPIATVSNPDGWTDEAGGTTDLHSPLAAQDASYDRSPYLPTNDAFTVTLGTLAPPIAGTRTLTVLLQKDGTGGTMDYTVNLRESDGTLIQSFSGGTLSDVSATETAVDLTVTNAISSYTGLRVEIIANQSG